MVLGRPARLCQFAGLSAALFAIPARAAGPPLASDLERPADVGAPACSFRRPVCVRPGAGVAPRVALRGLAAAELAFATLDALALPRPLGALDIHLDAALAPDAGPRLGIDLAALDGRPFDRASAFAVLPAGAAAQRGCALDGAVARAVGFAAAMGLDAGMERGAASAFASYVAHLAGACPADELEGVDAFQVAPERALLGGGGGQADGALLFPSYLDEAFGRGAPGAVLAGLLTVAGQRTPAGRPAFENEPDLFDALRANLRARGGSLDGMLLDFAIARGFVGSRDDGQHLSGAATYGDLGRVRVEWAVPFSSLPRRLAPSNPIEPTGTTYFWLDLAGAPKDAELTFVAEWEAGVLFRWALVKVDAEGAEVGRAELAGVNGEVRAEKTLVGLGGLAGVLAVGVNAGSVDRSHPFDPDEEHEPSACTVLFAP